jgi:hypothetical protein
VAEPGRGETATRSALSTKYVRLIDEPIRLLAPEFRVQIDDWDSVEEPGGRAANGRLTDEVPLIRHFPHTHEVDERHSIAQDPFREGIEPLGDPSHFLRHVQLPLHVSGKWNPILHLVQNRGPVDVDAEKEDQPVGLEEPVVSLSEPLCLSAPGCHSVDRLVSQDHVLAIPEAIGDDTHPAWHSAVSWESAHFPGDSSFDVAGGQRDGFTERVGRHHDGPIRPDYFYDRLENRIGAAFDSAEAGK